MNNIKKDKANTTHQLKPMCDKCHKSINGKLITRLIQFHDWGDKPLYKYELIHECCEKVYRYEITLVTEPWSEEIIDQYDNVG